MGFLRTLLAISVVFAHLAIFDKALTTPFNYGAVVAVKLFFVISGFYMSLVLDLKYRDRTFRFYRSRFLRLYPIYWATLILTVVHGLMVSDESLYSSRSVSAFSDLISMNWAAAVAWGGANATFFGLDLGATTCVGVDSVTPFCREAHAVYLSASTLVPQAWSLGIEVSFYLIAPFVFKHGLTGIVTLLVASILFRVVVLGNGYLDLPWDRSVFLSEFTYFALGMISYKFYRAAPTQWFTKVNCRLLLLLSVSAFLIYAWMVPVTNVNVGDRRIIEMIFHWIFFFVSPVVIPFVFHLTRESKIDFLVGELSYPIYITHLITLVMFFQHLGPFMRDSGMDDLLRMFVSVGVVIVGASLATLLVSVPVEYLRGRTSMAARIGKS